MFNEKFIGNEGIMDGSGPVERSQSGQELSRLGFAGSAVALDLSCVVLQRVGPAIVDRSAGEAVQEAGQVAVYIVDVLDRKRRQVDDERG